VAPPSPTARLESDAIPPGLRQRISPHQQGIGDVLAALTLLGEAPKELIVIGIEPADLTFGVGLSPVIEAKLDALVAAVVTELGPPRPDAGTPGRARRERRSSASKT
jgi:hydrogenase maturation protease